MSADASNHSISVPAPVRGRLLRPPYPFLQSGSWCSSKYVQACCEEGSKALLRGAGDPTKWDREEFSSITYELWAMQGGRNPHKKCFSWVTRAFTASEVHCVCKELLKLLHDAYHDVHAFSMQYLSRDKREAPFPAHLLGWRGKYKDVPERAAGEPEGRRSIMHYASCFHLRHPSLTYSFPFPGWRFALLPRVW